MRLFRKRRAPRPEAVDVALVILAAAVNVARKQRAAQPKQEPMARVFKDSTMYRCPKCNWGLKPDGKCSNPRCPEK